MSCKFDSNSSDLSSREDESFSDDSVPPTPSALIGHSETRSQLVDSQDAAFEFEEAMAFEMEAVDAAERKDERIREEFRQMEMAAAKEALEPDPDEDADEAFVTVRLVTEDGNCTRRFLEIQSVRQLFLFANSLGYMTDNDEYCLFTADRKPIENAEEKSFGECGITGRVVMFADKKKSNRNDGLVFVNYNKC